MKWACLVTCGWSGDEAVRGKCARNAPIKVNPVGGGGGVRARGGDLTNFKIF